MEAPQTTQIDPDMEQVVRDGYRLADHDYGKDGIRLLYVERRGPVHHIRELKVSVRLELSSVKDYVSEDNSQVVATDTMKNTVHVLARQNGVTYPETFALVLVRHFLMQYPHVNKAQVHIEKVPWQRMKVEDGFHRHAFMHSPSATHVCSATITRLNSGKLGEPIIRAGIRGMRVLKTTQSKFTNFYKDEFRTLPDAPDRVFATEVTAEWQYCKMPADPEDAWRRVQDAIIRQFAGPARTGVLSPSVQYTLRQAQLAILRDVAEIISVDISMPNLHYLPQDLSKFTGAASCATSATGDVLLPVSEPSGLIHARLERRDEELRAKL